MAALVESCDGYKELVKTLCPHAGVIQCDYNSQVVIAICKLVFYVHCSAKLWFSRMTHVLQNQKYEAQKATNLACECRLNVIEPRNHLPS